MKVRIKRGRRDRVGAAAPIRAILRCPACAGTCGSSRTRCALQPVPLRQQRPRPSPKKSCTWCGRRSWGRSTNRPRPGSPPFVKPGDTIEAGQVLCIVEAMKLMNEIESDVAGELVKRLVTNGQPMEYGQELFAIRPKK